ncbi:RTA1 domain-containing protein [Gaeumannomyces tritici R3-111a-1]|uniref:RTA1 domain-containing protein n=1 Tax=Gaeumannomyces tritici (strain R3-111a-1) TaxID=644352 RepID=J3NUR6_GAET3|nr:RTA1 domain-containing protein [Gaeumannomyces tritici R3-111a-1]EJT79940.1 RTA1 domain-containing protein [Gaeumannomyces tritici R3-111a-1]
MLPLADLHGARPAWPPRTGPSGCVVYAQRGTNGYLPPTACDARHPYPLDLAPAVAVACLFALLAALHAATAVLTRKTYCWVLVAGATLEAASYALRAAASRDQASLPLAAAHALLARVAPLWASAFVHMTFARAVLYYAPSAAVCRVPAAWVSTGLVSLDGVSFALQVAGSVLLLSTSAITTTTTTTNPTATGSKVLVAGVALHAATTVLLASLMAAFAVRMARYDAERGRGFGAGVAEPTRRSWRPLHWALGSAAALLTVRDVFRLVELGLTLAPPRGRRAAAVPLLRSERYGYALDALPVLLCLVVLAVVHPGRFLVGHDAEFPTLAERRRAERAMRELEEQKQAQFGVPLGGSDWARERGWD